MATSYTKPLASALQTTRTITRPKLRSRGLAKMKAVVIEGTDARLVHDRPLPNLRADYVLVKPFAVALNPTDWKHVAYERAKNGALVGCDYAGVVEEVGRAVTKTWSKGDRICGCTHGSNLVNEEDGAFAEYIVAKGDVQMRIPDHLSYEKATTISLGAITVGQGLYQKSLKINLPTDPIQTKEYVLIYGGGTATGGLAIQFATLYVPPRPWSCEVKRDIFQTSPLTHNAAKVRIFCHHSVQPQRI